MRKFFIGGLLLLVTTFAATPAKLNVITDLGYGARIYVDGILAGRDAIQNYQIEPGEHYISVVYNNKKIFAKTYKVNPGQLKTISTAHFVDFKTDVANRGAVEIEAARIRETRGNLGLGGYSSTAAGGISFKWWLTSHLGLHVYGLIDNPDGGSQYQGGGRALIWLADKVAFNAPFSGYLFFGGGYTNLINDENSLKNIQTNSTHGGAGIEFGLFGINGLFISLEAGLENKYHTYSDSSKKAVMKGQTFGGGGIHFYF